MAGRVECRRVIPHHVPSAIDAKNIRLASPGHVDSGEGQLGVIDNRVGVRLSVHQRNANQEKH